MPFNNLNWKCPIKTVGIILIIMWVSQIPYLFPHPFQENKGIRDLATQFFQAPDWIKRESSVKAKTADELSKRMVTELRIVWIQSALFIVIGVLSGCLLIQRRKEGYLLAFFFSLFILGIRFVHFLQYRTVTFSIKYYEFLLHRAPVRTIHDFLMLSVLLYIAIVIMYIFVTRKPANNQINGTITPNQQADNPIIE